MLQGHTFRDRIPDSTQGQIIEATLSCIAERGIAATSTYAIAEHAGVNQGNIHYYFRSKEELLLRVLELLYENSKANIEQLANSDLAPRAKLEGIIDLGFDLTGRRQDEFIALIGYWAHAMAAGGEWREAYKRTFESFRRAVSGVIEEGERLGEFKGGSTQVAAAMLVAIVQGIGLQSVMAPEQVDREAARLAAKKLMATIVPPPGRHRRTVSNAEHKDSEQTT